MCADCSADSLYDLEQTLRDLHTRCRTIFYKDKCAECGRVWPCDTIIALDNHCGYPD